jgi:hypothetical protein
MIEVESAPVTTKKRNIVLWPSIVLLAMVFGFWVFLYDDPPGLLLLVGIQFFAAICFICFICLIVLRGLRKSLSFLFPALLAAAVAWGLILPMVKVMLPIRTSFMDSRDYVEFLVYNARHQIKAEAQQNRYRYKVWHLYKHSTTAYSIVYDATDETLMENNDKHGACYSEVFSLGDHFYFVRGECIGF